MKRIICLLLTAIILLLLCACSTSTEENAGKEAPRFQVGFGRVNITPSGSVPLDGYEARMSEGGFLNYIFATCVALTDPGNNTLLLYTLDMCNTERETIEALRERLTSSTGIHGENITISATHTHASPAAPYADDYIDNLVRAGEEALSDRAPATITAGAYNVPDMNFVRHYVMNDGTMKGDNFGLSSSGYKEHASESDKTMQLIRFQREGEKKDVLMINWQVHPKLSSTNDTKEGQATRNLLSSDFIGFARDHVEANADVLFAYYTGAAGNLNPFSKLPSEKNIVTKDVKQYGVQFGGHVISALAHLSPLEAGSIASKTAPLGDRGFNLHAYTVGNSLGFAAVPAEIFHETGTQIRKGSPCAITFVLTSANGRDTYIPTENVWDYKLVNDVLPYEIRICRYPKGTAEVLARDLAAMLTALSGAQAADETGVLSTP